MASKGLRDAARVVRRARYVGNALPLIASSRTAFVFAAAASAPLLQRPRAIENATRGALRGANQQDPTLTGPNSQHVGRAAIAGMLPDSR
ncbi:hypothetical protein EOS_15015 [Caballeronia mineralivorans PML1(12)]|uniref:Uncharacterized protein n=1 Tax=Caballeronia mineralivorans PML1(12) TaxID=908627 RepID=A0A0J1CXL1_9BURK|nr:hypothetical protein EOS_15015 [Caballeronia mineralivorans PML1(12)]